MRTWSAERALDGLLTGLGNIAGISASAILEILWPTPVDPAEQLAEREAEEEVAEPKFAPMSCCGGVLFHHHCPEANARRAADVGPTITGIKRHARDFGADFIGPVLNEREPALSDDELVAVRGLIQERYGNAQRERVEKLERDIFSSPTTWGVNPGDESAPHSQAAASPATVGEEPPDPAVAGHFNLNRTIASVLSWHQFRLVNHSSIGSADHCGCGARPNGIYEWEQHVAPFIAECFTAQPK